MKDKNSVTREDTRRTKNRPAIWSRWEGGSRIRDRDLPAQLLAGQAVPEESADDTDPRRKVCPESTRNSESTQAGDHP